MSVETKLFTQLRALGKYPEAMALRIVEYYCEFEPVDRDELRLRLMYRQTRALERIADAAERANKLRMIGV